MRRLYACQGNEPFSTVHACDERCSSELVTDRVQNILLQQVAFPTEVRHGDKVAEVWTHTLPPDMRQHAFGLLRLKDSRCRCWLRDSTPESFIAFCHALEPVDFRLTGAMAVHFTIPVDGRLLPTIRVTLHNMGPYVRETFWGMRGTHVAAAPGHYPMTSPETIQYEWASLPWIGQSKRPKRQATKARGSSPLLQPGLQVATGF